MLQFTEVRVTGALGVLLRLHLTGQRGAAVAAFQRELLHVGVLARRFRLVGQLMGLQQHGLVGDLEHGLAGRAVLDAKMVLSYYSSSLSVVHVVPLTKPSKYNGS